MEQYTGLYHGEEMKEVGERERERRGGREKREKREKEGEEENVTSEHKFLFVLAQMVLDGITPRDLVLRVQNLEMRLLELEARSTEYHHPEVRIISSVWSTETHLVCV